MIRISDFQQNWKHLQSKKLFLACSGGVDSMVLLHLLRQSGANLTVLHVNYQLRGEDSEGDEQLVRKTCETLQIPLKVKKLNTKSLLEKSGNLQEITRKFRYAWFRNILSQDENNLIVLGHHQDDQVETFFQHLARRSGITGMACMLEEHAGITRPLLQYSKEEIYAFAKENKLAWREDLSNAGNTYTRNKLRNVILPKLEKEIPGLRQSVLVLVKAFQETQKVLEMEVSPVLQEIKESGNWFLTDYDLLSIESQAEVLRSLGIRQTFIAEIQKIRFSQKGKRLLVDGFVITRESNCLHFEKTGTNVDFKLNVKRVYQLPDAFNKDIIYLDALKINGVLQLRKWKTGDRMQPVGMKGTKLISDLLNDAKIPAYQKEKVLVLTDDTKILWCVGIKVSAEAIPDQETPEILELTVEVFES